MERVPDDLDLTLAGGADQRPAYAVAHCADADLAQAALVGVGVAQEPGLVHQVESDPTGVVSNETGVGLARLRTGSIGCVNNDEHTRGRSSTPTAAVIDAQSNRASPQGGDRGVDAANKAEGRKRNLVVDTMELLDEAYGGKCAHGIGQAHMLAPYGHASRPQAGCLGRLGVVGRGAYATQ